MFTLNSNINIGSFAFHGVHDVSISRSIHSIIETAVIKIPSIAKIIKEGQGSPETVITGNQFSEGDPVTISLGYNGFLVKEFQGFVQKRDMNMPLEVTCEGYSWLLKRNVVNISAQNISVHDLLQAAISGIDSTYKIDIICTTGCVMANVQVNGNGLDVIKKIMHDTDGCLSCFFIAPGVLWCGTVYTPYAQGNDLFNQGLAQYRLGYNVMKENDLDVRTLNDDVVTVQYNKKLGAGSVVGASSSVFGESGRSYSRILNQITDASTMQELADEKAYRINYAGYEGTIQTFLQPYAGPGFQAYITDSRYPDQDGNYLVESVTTHYDVNGARRIVEIGPETGFANKQ